MRKIIFTLFILVVFNSCSPEEDEPLFYKFSNSDYEYIPTAYEDIGRVYTFKNQLNDEEVHISVLHYRIVKTSGGGLSFTQPYSEFYYYQRLWITLSLDSLNSCGERTVDFSITKNKNETIWTKVGFPKNPYPCNSGALFWVKPPYDNLDELVIGNVRYTKVETFITDNSFVFYDDSEVTKIYYDLKEGIIGFDNLDGKEWRLVN